MAITRRAAGPGSVLASSPIGQATPVEDPINGLLERVLHRFLAERRREAVAIHPCLGRLVDELETAVTSGGKRLRPLLAAWGFRAAGAEVSEAMVRAAASLELLHTFALIQDDVMDGSAIRRGRPAAHVTLSAAAEIGDRARFGASAAILLGDLALIWSDRLLAEAGFPPERLAAGLAVHNELRSEVTLGQYLDILAGHRRALSEDDALRVCHYKTASYTMLRPIQFGMVLGGGRPELIEAVPAYAIPAGIAFQLRDDLLSAFGDPELTGKPSGQDLRERKPTWLWAHTLRLCPEAGRLDDVARLRQLMISSGAVADTEAKIRQLTAEALAGLDRIPVPRDLVRELTELTERLVWRTS
jgi:geranylgeranyl diphosphate synthase type I